MCYTAKQIFQWLLSLAPQQWEQTCDRLLAGDENRPVERAAVCFKLTVPLIRQAMEKDIHMIVTHEPLFANGDDGESTRDTDIQKWELLCRSGIVVYRFHDHAHLTEPDSIHEGFLNKLGLPVEKMYPNECFAARCYDVGGSLTALELAKRIKARLGLDLVKIVGDPQTPANTLCLGLGAVGQVQLDILFRPGVDIFITGEIGEVCAAEKVRDACQLGQRKALLILGHFGAEYAGMELLAARMNEKLLPTEYLQSGEVFTVV